MKWGLIMGKTIIRNFSLRVEDVILKKFRYICGYNGRSINSQLLIYMRTAIARFEIEHGVIETNTKDEN